MSKEKPEWTVMIKESSVRKGVFSEEMKRTVIFRVEQNEKKKNRQFLYIATPMIGLLLFILFLPNFNPVSAIDQFVKTANTKMGSEATNDIILMYEPAKDLQYIPSTDKAIRGFTLSQQPLSSVHIKESSSNSEIAKYFDYTKSEDDLTLYFGFQITNQFSTRKGEFYEIGYGRLSDVTFQESSAFGLSDFRLEGNCGPERRCVYWVSVDQDKVMVYEQMDAQTIYEQDLDGDGVPEAIILTYSQDIYIYKNIDGQIQSVHIQAALRADSGDTVTYDPHDQIFQLNSKHETKRYQYTIGKNKLHQVYESDISES